MTAAVLMVAWIVAMGGQGLPVRAPIDQAPSTTAAVPSLARARALYEAAAYEESLAALPDRVNADEADDVDRYRALCLLALGRTAEAEGAIEQALVRNPSFRLIEGEVSPRVLEFFRDVRRRVLPIRTESLYARARADFEDRAYAEAATKFSIVLELLSDPDVASVGKLADLRLVAEEFRRLALERLPESVRRDLDASGTIAQHLDADRVYTRLSTTVKPPVEISRELPPSNPPKDQAWRTFRGVVEVLIDRNGRVESARMLERIGTFYDGPLVEAARNWRFEPATLNGEPVRFRQQIEIVLRP